MNRRDAICLVGASVTGIAMPEMLTASAASGTVADSRRLIQQFDTFLNGFHVNKKTPDKQTETNHLCMRLSEDVYQCVIFHATSRKLLGVEYIISDHCYRRLPLEEKAYWHPHAYEILAGQLIAPDLPAQREDDMMRDLVTTWGKTWQTWPDPALDLPEGEPELLWSITRDAQLDPELLADRDHRFRESTSAQRTHRQQFGYPVPQVAPPESVQEIGRQWNGSEPKTLGVDRRRV